MNMIAIALLACLAPDGEAPLRILEKRCLECHHGEKRKGGLDLSRRDLLLRGGETGPAIASGDPAKSLLWQVVAREKEPHMPHKRDKLPQDEIRALADWIKAGAPYDRPLLVPAKAAEAKPFAVTQADRKHWAFVPLRRTEPPGTDGHPIDRFVRARLSAAGLQPAAPASRETLIRRATFDLIGLPPTIAEIDAFLGDTAPDAWEKVIDRLLASPHYGERWGRHWLDLARFGETDGFEHDAVRPHSWRYRDYVIRAFNADKPFDRFLREQLAGDELWPAEPDALIATGFNLLGPDMVDSSDQIQRRINTLNDMTDTASSVFLGLTLGCARCHDHKFEPLPQRDYYRLQAFFTSAQFKRETPVPTPGERADYEAKLEAYNAIPQVRELGSIEKTARLRARDKKISALTPEAQEAIRTPPEQRTTEQENLAIETEPLLEITERDLAAEVAAGKARRKELQEELKKLPKAPSMPVAMTMVAGKPAKTFILHRGEHSQPREEVKAGFPEVLGGGDGSASGRAALAAWVVAHPLTARVAVNRIWQHHFGRGLASTPSEVGSHGQPPTHPELLDWLASEFVARGWSVKAMHRLILASETWRQSSIPTAAAARRDPENLQYSRTIRLRIEGEAIRDALLAISGRLNPALGGPSVRPPIPPEAVKGTRGGYTPSPDPRDHARRSVYIFVQRTLRFPFLEVFDAPDSNLSCPQRGRSTTAPQSLTLLNAPEVMAAAKATAERLQQEAENLEARIVMAYRLILGRRPTDSEIGHARKFLDSSPLSELCRALYNVNGFVYLE